MKVLFLMLLVSCASKPAYEVQEYEIDDLKTLLRDARKRNK